MSECQKCLFDKDMCVCKEKHMTNALADMARDIAHGLTLRIDQKVAVCIKPKPRFITQNMWLRIAAVFIYIEKTQPSMTMKGETHER